MEAADNRGRRRTTGTEMASTDKGPQRRAAKEAGRKLATSEKDQSRDALQSGANQTAKMLRAPKQRAAEGAEEASARAGDLLEEARSRLEEQVAAGAERVAENLRRFGEQGIALAGGRPQDAPDIGDHVRQAADKLLEAAQLADALADDVASGGIEGFLGHIGGVARRRPGLLVLATAAALFAAVPTAPTARPPDGGDADEEDPARDRLEAAALDALLRALWPGDVDEGSAANRQRSAGPGRLRQLAVRPKERMGPREGRRAEAGGSVTGEQPGSTQSAKRVKKAATRAAGEVQHGVRARVQSPEGQTPVASDQVKDETAEAPPPIKAQARPSSGAGKNAKRARGTAESEPPTTTRAAKAPLAKSASAASSRPARGRAPARHSEQ